MSGLFLFHSTSGSRVKLVSHSAPRDSMDYFGFCPTVLDAV
jgi:hypothetical protein